MMSPVACLLAVLAVAAGPDRAPAPLPAERAAAGCVLPDGFRCELFAAEPMVVQPVSFTTDARGRLWVAEALNYGAWQPTGKDRIVILEDTDGDGRADRRTVFYEGFNYVTGVEVGFGGVWVVSPPGLYFVPDRDGDDRPDGPPELVFDGFGYKESRHNLANGFTWGPDGWLYGGHGRTSPSDVGRPGTPPEKRTHCDGGVFRVHPTRRAFELFADGTTNPWGVDFDDRGECFVSNCVTPHLFHMLPGGHYEPWRNRPSSRFAYERLPTIADHLHYAGDKPLNDRGATPETQSLGGGHAHCGTLVYLADRFPASYRNTAFLCNVHGRRVNNDILRPVGSGYVASHGRDFLLSPDPWFMGVTLRQGPGGGVYVSDWSDTGECHTYNPDRTTGRVYHVSYGPPDRTRVDLGRLSDAELVDLQGDRNDWFVRHARRLLQERAAAPGWDAGPVHARLRAMLAADGDAPRRLRALWALHVTGGLDADRLLALLGDRSEHVRGWAVRLLCEAGTPPAAVLAKFAAMAAGDPSPVVRLQLASALQRLPLAERWAIAASLLAHAADVTDANLPLMNWYAVEPLVPADPPRALRLAAGSAIPLVRRFAARRAADEAADLAPLVAAVGRANEAVALDLLRGARDGLRGRRNVPMPADWPATYTKMRQTGSQSVRDESTGLALLFGDPEAVRELLAVARDPAAPAAGRVAAVEALVDARPADLAAALHALLVDPATRRAALRGLAAVPHADTPAKVLAVYPTLPADERADAVAALAARVESAVALLAAVEAGTVPRADVSAFAARQMHALGDRRVSDRLRAVWGEVRESSADKRKQVARLKSQLTPVALKAADVANGKLLFTKSCGQCHRLFGEGGTIGPDLTGSNRSDLDYLLSNIVDPSAEVAKDYRMSVVRAADGRVLTGILVERSAARTVVQTATERAVLAAEDVESVTPSAASIMPDGLLDGLTREQVRDLIAYIGAKGPPGRR